MNTVPAGIHTVAIFGGSGATGKALIYHALIRGIKVRALVRNASSLNIKSGLIEVIEGSLSSADHVDFCLKGCDAAFCVFGHRPPYTDIFCEAATRNIVESMHKLGIKRMVCQTGGMIGDYPANRTLPFRVMVAMFNRRLPLVASDRTGQENAVKQSGLDWTIVKPSRLTNGKAEGRWLAGPDVRVSLLSSIARDDLADFLLQEAFTPQFAGQAVFIRR
ncbi:MAG TPA: NAD(P)H-binding protein [Gallionella sp.]|nr:NAD(P)H-binding protein [Gallionella sp.]